jgi:hypothetical protein
MQNKNLNFPAHSMSVKIKNNQNILSSHTTSIYLLNGGKIQILILHGANAIKIYVFLDLLTILIFPVHSAPSTNLMNLEKTWKRPSQHESTCTIGP